MPTDKEYFMALRKASIAHNRSNQMTDRKKMIEVIADVLAYEPIMSANDKAMNIADRLIEAGFGRVK
jgi:hypothetical protein